MFAAVSEGMELTAIVEALIFASPEPVSSSALARCLQDAEGPGEGFRGEWMAPRCVSVREVEEAVAHLNAAYGEQGRAFQIVAEAGGWRFLSHPDFAPWIERLLPDRKTSRLSPAALETLAIIAYRQPVTKLGIEEIRGVGIDGVLQTVLDRGLARVVGRAAVPGRPLLYGTTDFFLEHFGLRGLDDLPNAAELRLTGRSSVRESSGTSGEKRTEEEQLVFEALPRSGDNAALETPQRLSPVAAARKLAENLGKPIETSHPPTQP